MRTLIQVGYRARRLFLRLLRIRTRGVKVMVFNRVGELLLVRNSYGDTQAFVLPGGGIGRREPPEAAAAREVREETGLDIAELRFVAAYGSRREGKRDKIDLFRAVADGAPLADGVEVAEAAFFGLDALPAGVSPATLRRIRELRGEQPLAALW
jgi:ADP-ribose pyrophosphatase YjhB (NUDIX family)